MAPGRSPPLARLMAAAGMLGGWTVVALFALSAGCVGRPNLGLLVNPGGGGGGDQKFENDLRRLLSGTRISLKHDSFHDYKNPNANACAGDAIRFAAFPGEATDPISSYSTAFFGESSTNAGETLRPAFIRNLSVDLTDTTTLSTYNLSRTCSARLTTQPNPSRCATFDLDARANAGFALAGSLVLMAGQPQPSEHSLSPPAHGPSPAPATWVNLKSGGPGTGAVAVRPTAALEPAISVDRITERLLWFGGARPKVTSDTWILDAKTGLWKIVPTTLASQLLQSQLDRQDDGTFLQLPKIPTERSLFEYLPVRNFQSTRGTPDLSLEKILIAGGVIPQGALQDTYLFNPTFGPEKVELASSSPAQTMVEWVEPFPIRRLSSTQTQTLFGQEAIDRPNFTFQLNSTTVDVTQDRFFPAYPVKLVNDEVIRLLPGSEPASGTTWPATLAANTNYYVRDVQGAGNSFQLCVNPGCPTPIDLTTTGSGFLTVLRSPSFIQGALIQDRNDPTFSPFFFSGFSYDPNEFGPTGDTLFRTGLAASVLFPGKSAILFQSALSGPGRHELDPDGNRIHAQNTDIHGWPSTVPAAGGVPPYGGFSLNQLPPRFPGDATRMFVYLGGASCRNYLTNPANSACSFNNTPYYGNSTVSFSNNTAHSNDNYRRAGMAAAAGYAGNGQVPVVVHFGGARPSPGTGPNQQDPRSILIAFPQDPYPNGPVALVTISTTSGPPALANAQMVYSHITRKFYLYGGFLPSNSTPGGGAPQTSGDTWELTLGGNAGTFSASWRRLDSVGLTCWPECPGQRRSHRMVEVSYEVDAACTANDPCSHGIFMEGGTPDGINPATGRWMFDPTANSGAGHWQKVDLIPPRRLAASATYEITLPITGERVTRAVVFGGETALQDSPIHADSTGTFIPPTLGDTLIYEFKTERWGHAHLFGKSYQTNFPGGLSSLRQAESTLAVPAPLRLSPPPLSGALAVTRTHDGSGNPLAVQEIYLLGGRLKNGDYQPLLSEVWKFCPQSPGEDSSSSSSPQNPECDVSNLSQEASGRWLPKSTVASAVPATEAVNGAFLSAATYDSGRDRIIVAGGYRSGAAPGLAPMTGSAAPRDPANGILELNPATLQWQLVPPCNAASAPAPRFGHALHYDASRGGRLMLVGGFSASSSSIAADTDSPTALTTPDPDGRNVAEVWSAKFVPAFGVQAACYDWRLLSSESLDGNGAPVGGFGSMGSALIPSKTYGTGTYLLQDSQCLGQGPILGADPSASKRFAGGVSIDLERGELGLRENLLMQLTYLPLRSGDRLPDGNTAGAADQPVFEIQLIAAGVTRAQMQATEQPRYLAFFDSLSFPRIVGRLSVLAPRDGELREEQIIIPLSTDVSIDRIRIERVSGSAVLMDVSLQRLGPR